MLIANMLIAKIFELGFDYDGCKLTTFLCLCVLLPFFDHTSLQFFFFLLMVCFYSTCQFKIECSHRLFEIQLKVQTKSCYRSMFHEKSSHHVDIVAFHWLHNLIEK